MNFEVGDRVYDRDGDSDADAAIVISVPEKSISETQIPNSQKTVADVNPEYAADASVVSVVFEPRLKSTIPDWHTLSKTALQETAEEQLTVYSYPAPRLGKEGLTIRFEGVAHPITQDSGAYAYEIEDGSETIGSESGLVTEYDRVMNTTARLFALSEALENVVESKREIGIQAYTSEETVVNHLTGDYEARTEEHQELCTRIQNSMEKLPYVTVQTVPHKETSKARKLATESYEKYKGETTEEPVERNESDSDSRSEETTETEVQIEQIVESQYLVENTFAVDIEKNTCTCDSYTDDGVVCDHINSVKTKTETPE